MATFLSKIKNELKLWPDILKNLPSESIKTAAKIPTPGKELARGIGYALNIPFIKETARDVEQKELKFQNTLLQEYKKAGNEGNVEKQERLEDIMEDFKFTNVIAETMEDAPTTRQVIASAGELTLLAAMGYKPYLRTGELTYGGALKATTGLQKMVEGIQKAEKISKAGVAGKIFHKFGVPIAKQATIGGAFFGTMEATERDSTIKDIVKAAETGAIFGGGITAAAIGVGEGVGFLGRKYGPTISSKWQSAMASLEKTAAGKKITKKKSQIEETLSYIGQKDTFKQKTAKITLKGIESLRKTEAKLIDRFAPGKRIETRIAQAKGKPLSETEKIYRDMRLFTSVSDASAEKKVISLIDKIGNFDEPTKRKSIAWMAQLDFIDRARLGQKVPGNQSLDDLILGLKKLSQEIGPDDMKNVAKIKQAFYNHNVSLLQERVKAGLISEEFKNVLLKTHPNYIRHDVILAADERAAQGLSSSLNVPKTDIMKAIGSAKNIKDPLEATIGQTQIATRVIEKNKILNNFVKAQEQYNLFPGMEKVYQTIKTPEGFRKVAASMNYKPPSGFDVISLFRNGKKETWQVPADIAAAIRNIDAPITPGWWKFLTTPQRILKKGATQYNLSFALPNKFRDKQTAALTSKAFIESLAQKTGVSPKFINLTDKKLKELYKSSGGYGASIFKEGESKILTDLGKFGMNKTLSSSNPAKIINEVNNRIETSTRMVVFKSALQRGLSAKDAALISRDATIDFAKMGSWMKPLNQAIPFLNARVQGFINLPRAIIANPETFARMQMYTAVYPTLATHQHNRRFESYKNISQYFKNKYWIIMTGETDGVDSYTGDPIKVPQFVTIPKGEGQTLVSGPIQYYLEKSDGVDFRKTSEMIADTIGSASPLEFQTWGGGNAWLTLAGQLGPGVSIPAGLASGKVPYTGMQIVPESRETAEPYMQFTKYTPEVVKEAGKILNVSPAQIDFIISSFGGLPQDVLKAVDIAYGVVRDGKLGGNSITETPWGSLTQIPLARRFVRESAERGSEREFRYQQKEEIQRESETEKLKVYDVAEEIWQEMNKKETEEDKLNYLNSLGEELTPEIKKRIMYLKGQRQAVESLKPTDSVDLRAKYILQRLEEMKAKELPREDRVKFLDELEVSKILTPIVKQKIQQLQNYE
jgi:hypothetical protein